MTDITSSTSVPTIIIFGTDEKADRTHPILSKRIWLPHKKPRPSWA